MAPSAENVAPAFNFSRASVAIIDTNSLCMELLTNILRGFGFRNSHRCATLASGADAVKSNAIDLVLIDPHQHGELGFDFVRWLRSEKRSPSSQASVIIITAHTPVRLISSARQCGADYVIAKPFSITTLLGRILWVAQSEHRRGELMAPTDLVSSSGSGVELW